MNTNKLIIPNDGVFSFSFRERNWYWYLDLSGEPLVQISNVCDTCTTIFDFVTEADLPLAPEELSQMLNQGFDTIPANIPEMVKHLLPKGLYTVGMINPTPHRPKGYQAHFFREDFFYGKRFWLSKCREFAIDEVPEWHYEILLPIVREDSLSPAQVAVYKEALQAGEIPVALTLSIDDLRYPSGKGIEHVLAHIILDGHHKIQAAGELGMPIRVLSFLYRGEADRPFPVQAAVDEYYQGKPLEFRSLRTPKTPLQEYTQENPSVASSNKPRFERIKELLQRFRKLI